VHLRRPGENERARGESARPQKGEIDMDTIVTTHLARLKIGDPQTHENMTVFPLFQEAAAGPDYVTLDEAIEGKHISVEEIGEEGRVPDIKVVNHSGEFVLLVDGEEVAGAKQNRIINTSILIRSRTEVTIPVSCTERGRWSYRTRKFFSSGHISPSYLRSMKSDMISKSLKAKLGYYSSQHHVWSAVNAMFDMSETSSDTDAMKEMYDQKAPDLGGYLDAFECLPGQVGCVLCIGGDVQSAETVSREDAYRKLHKKIVKSCAIDATWRKDTGEGRPDHEAVEAFLHEIESSKESRYDSVGEGLDFRYEGDRLAGAALVAGEAVLHSAYFRLDAGEAEINEND
jgi:hypothetical protein